MEQGQSVRSPSPEEEAAAETTCGDRNPHSPSLCTAQGEEAEKIGSKVKPRKKEGVEGRSF